MAPCVDDQLVSNNVVGQNCSVVEAGDKGVKDRAEWAHEVGVGLRVFRRLQFFSDRYVVVVAS